MTTSTITLLLVFRHFRVRVRSLRCSFKMRRGAVLTTQYCSTGNCSESSGTAGTDVRYCTVAVPEGPELFHGDMVYSYQLVRLLR
jgi:hypothetical protein